MQQLLGHDSLLMAYLGADVRLIERHPIPFVLLEYTKAQAEQRSFSAICCATDSTHLC